MEKPGPNLTFLPMARWVLGCALRRWPMLLLSFANMLLRVGLDVLKPWPVVLLIDYVLRGRTMPPGLAHAVGWLPGAATPENMINWSIVATLVIFLLDWLVNLATSYTNIALSQRMTYDLAGDLLTKLQQLSLHFHTKRFVGDNIFRITGDAAAIASIFQDALMPASWATINVVVMFSILCRIDVGLAVPMLVMIPYMIFIFQRYAVPMKQLSVRQQKSKAAIFALVEQIFSAIPVVQAFSRERLNDEAFSQANQNYITAAMSLARAQIRFKILLGVSGALGTAAVLWFGAHKAMAGTLGVGTIVLFMSYLGSLFRPLQSIVRTGSTVQGFAGSAQRVWEILQTESTVVDRPGAVPLRVTDAHVQLENVSFSYEPGRPVLRHISLELPAGRTTALVGASGAGKSTLAGLLPRFFDPTEGRVLIDGQDIRGVRLKSLRGSISLVLQDPFLFPMSIAENIAYGDPHAGMDKIEAAARHARAHDFIMKLPKGYQTVIGDRGATLSGGERQRISIARAFLKNAPILILDEPFSELDAATEQSLVEVLDQLTRGRTTLIIAHRLSAIRRADRIVVLRDAGVAESGTHDELVEQNGVYARFHELQAR